MAKFFRSISICAFTLTLAACDQTNASLLKRLDPTLIASSSEDGAVAELNLISELDDLIEKSHPKVDLNAGFKKAMIQALDQDPAVLSAKRRAAASKENLLSTKSEREIQINATILGGAEDITDETVGIAGILTAKRMLYDGGMLNAKIDSDMFKAQAAEQAYLATRDARALRLSQTWIELELYQSLMELISSRLAVLDPLLVQLEKVASAGVGDVSQVAAAQRVVSSILVEETNVTARYNQAQISFVNGFGRLPSEARFDASWVSSEVPVSSTKKLAESSSGLLAKYWEYWGGDH